MSVQGSLYKPRRHSFAGTAVSDVNGNAVFNFVPPFPAVPVVEATSEAAVAGQCRIVALTAGACTVLVATGAVSTPVQGATVHLFATEPGRVVP